MVERLESYCHLTRSRAVQVVGTMQRQIFSLNIVEKDADKNSLGDIIPAPQVDYATPEKVDEIQRILAPVLMEIPQKERLILSLKYVLRFSVNPLTKTCSFERTNGERLGLPVEGVGALFSISKQRVSQIEKKAIKCLLESNSPQVRLLRSYSQKEIDIVKNIPLIDPLMAPITSIDLDRKIIKTLRSATPSINTIEELANASTQRLLSISNFAEKTLAVVYDSLVAAGIKPKFDREVEPKD